MNEQEINRLATSLTHFLAIDYTILAGAVIWGYDILLTLDDEVSLLWTRGGWFIKILYLTVSLVSIVFSRPRKILTKPITISMTYFWYRCQLHFAFLTLCQATGVMVATTMFIFRLYTLFYFSRKMRVLLVTSVVASHISVVTFTVFLCYDYQLGTMSYSDQYRSCVSDLPGLLGAFYAAPIFIESVIALATLYHAWVYRRSRSQARSNPVKMIISSLYVDGFLYYLVCYVNVIQISQYWFAPNTLAFLTSYFEHAVTSAITSRWFLSFRKVLLVFDDHSVSSRSAPRAISIEVSHTTFELPERSRTIPFSPNRERQKLQPISEADYPW
ncbi:hypothetical protein CPB86DRAFT_699571 [Serendipita vermifera]|nr:hypothetical protein CPB86DRAFT_699571 [Serendipita vermifera]